MNNTVLWRTTLETATASEELRKTTRDPALPEVELLRTALVAATVKEGLGRSTWNPVMSKPVLTRGSAPPKVEIWRVALETATARKTGLRSSQRRAWEVVPETGTQ